MNCVICGKKSYSEYCFKHKLPKPIDKSSIKRGQSVDLKKIEETHRMYDFFSLIWNKRKNHTCSNCGTSLGNEPHSYMFDHILEKQKYPELKYEEDDIWYLCLQCHDEKTRGYLSPLMKEKQEEVKTKYNL